MNGVEIRTLPRRPALWLLGAALLCSLVPLWLLLVGAQEGQVLLSCLLMVAMTAAGWHVGVRLTRQQLGTALREARTHAQQLSQLQPDWQWQTDAEHHLVRWQAPLAAPASSWVGAAATQSLWERFVLADLGAAGEGASLRQRLDERVAFAGLTVAANLERGPAAQFAGRWLLRAQVCLDASGRFAGYIGTARPVVERGQDWLQALPGPAFLLSAAGAPRLLDLNAEAAHLIGQDAALLRGRPWVDCVATLVPDLRKTLELQDGESGATGRPLAHWQLAQRALPDGRLLLSLWPTPPAPDAAGERMAEHEAFSYTISHDLRSPLRVVEGFTRILKEDYGHALDRVGNEHLERISGAALRMQSMIEALLALSALSARPLLSEAVDLSRLAEGVVEDLRSTEPTRQVSVSIASHLAAQGDPTLLRVVLENLLGNAWKYSANAETARLSFEQIVQDGRAVFVISDNGAGFDMRFAQHLFGPFQRLHSASEFPGHGVGLASVRRIVQRHGGEVWAEGEVGRGARFYFTLDP